MQLVEINALHGLNRKNIQTMQSLEWTITIAGILDLLALVVVFGVSLITKT